MINFIQHGDVLDLTAPYAVSSGDGALVGSHLFGVAVTDVANAAVGAFHMEGVFTLTKSTGSSTGGSAGAIAYWDNTAKAVTAESTSNKKIGIFLATCADGDATAQVVVFPNV